MKKDRLRNHTVRFEESALRRIEAIAKPFYGGRISMGEAIRRLAEERLDEIERHTMQQRGPGTERAIRLYDANDAAALAQFLDSLFREPPMVALVECLMSCMRDHVSEFGAVRRSRVAEDSQLDR